MGEFRVITVIGSLNMDLITITEKSPRVGETLIGISFKQSAGGKGANQADSIAKLGGKVNMIGRVGEDDFGKALVQSLKKDGVDVSKISVSKKASTGIATIIVNGSGDNSIIVVPGANYEVTPSDIDNSIDVISKAKMIIAQLEVPLDTITYSFKKAKEYGVYTILNPAPAQPLSDELLRMTDLLVPNEIELEILSGKPLVTQDDMYVAARTLLNKGVKEIIVTLGSQGCLYMNENESIHYPAYKVEVVDTTAAGDSFIGGIATALSEGKPIKEAIGLATKVSALTVTRLGAQISLPLREEVENFL